MLLDFIDEAPDLSYYFHPLDYTYSDAAFSETSADDSSSGTSFESGSEMSCEVDGIVEQAEVIQEPQALETNCQVRRQPAAHPPSPITSSHIVLDGEQEKEKPCSTSSWSMPSTTPCHKR
jgi:hypothetical protein